VPVIERPTEASTLQNPIQETTDDKIKRSFFDKYIDKIKDFLDNAE
jgi:cell division protein FtsA